MKRQIGWMWMAACGVGLLAVAAARADVVNGHFENPSDLYGWTVDGPVTVERVGSTATLPPNRLALLQETNSGGRTRIYQEFNLPNPLPSTLTFRFRLISTVPPASPTGYIP